MRNLVTDPNKIQINMKVVIPDWCSKRVGCAPADDCPFINAAVCSPGTCVDEMASFGCACTAPGVESSGVPACGGRYAGDSCSTGCRTVDPCRSITCVNGVCGNGACTCLPRFAAVSATVCVDVCNPNPCSGGATCEYGTGSQFTCVCPAGTTLQSKVCVPDAAVCNATTCQGPSSRCQSNSCVCDTPFVLDSTKQKCISPPTAASSVTRPTTTTSTTTSMSTSSHTTTTSLTTAITNNSSIVSANNASIDGVTSLGAESVGDSESTDSSTTVGIVAGVIAVLCVALIAAFACWWRAKSRSRAPTQNTTATVVNRESQRQPVYASARSDRFASERVSTTEIDAPTPIYGAGPRIPTDVYGAAPRMPTEVFGYGATPRISEHGGSVGGTFQQKQPSVGVYEHGSINQAAPPLYEDLVLARDGRSPLPYEAAPATGDVAAIRNSGYGAVPLNDGGQQNQYTPAPSKQL